MQNINEIITENFNDNISYIQSKHPDLFSKLSALDSAIVNGHYTEKYELVYENDNFDVFEKETQSFLYDKTSNYFAELAAKSIDYGLNENLFESFHKHNLSDEDVKKYEKEKPFEHHLSGYASIMHYIQEHSLKDKSLKSIEKFIFFGVGLGQHIETIHVKIDADVYFIIEDDLELFRLSLFSINYKNISQNAQLVFSVFEDKNEFLKSSTEFLDTLPYYNHYIKYFQMLNTDDEKRDLFHIQITNQPHLLFFYNALLTQYVKPLQYILKDYKFIKKDANLSSENLQKPFLLLAAGPSLEKNRVWIKENHHKFITIAITSILSYLEEENIIPDIVTHLDAFDNANMHFDKPKSLEFLKNTICIFSARLPIEIMQRFTKEQLFLFENGTQYLSESLKPSSPCVGSITYQILLLLKAKNIYILGLDQTIDSLTGKTHSSTQEYLNVLKRDEDAFHSDTMKFKESLFYVEGNYGKELLTTPHFKSAIDIINLSTTKLKQETQNIYNLSDGAKFIGIDALRPSEIDLDARVETENLFDLFDRNSFHPVHKTVVRSLNDKLQHASLIREIITKQQNTLFAQEDEFKDSLIEFIAHISNQDELQTHELSRVIDTYLRYITSYIFHFLNTQESKEKDYNFINQALTRELLKIVNYYYDKINNYL